MTESDIFKNHIIDLSRKSFERNVYTYTDFLTLAEQSDLMLTYQSGNLYGGKFSLYGGFDGAERVMARFGSSDDLGYEEAWPISCVQIDPLNKKFAEELNHRDVLGSLMNLGIERGLIGDILMPQGEISSICFFAKSHIADMLCNELTRIRHTQVCSKVADAQKLSVSLKTTTLNLQVKSERTDLIIAHIYNLSRSKAQELFLEKKVFINGRLMENESHILTENDIVSVRGYGRFVFNGVSGATRKGNLNVEIMKYI